jgi:cell fate regulator YaaT (PSP1 superfamily)
VVAETSRGLEVGEVKFLPREMEDTSIVGGVRPLIRLATSEDIMRDAENRELEERAMRLIKQRIHDHGLAMKPIKMECLLDRSKIYFFYESEERIDFRELLRDMSGLLEMRLQFQQVGAREAAKLLDGVGPCGQPLCCSTFLTTMPPVTLKLAKEQGLSLTPSKISGACGRLMCCLRYEIDFYRDQNQKLPRPGDAVDSPEGPGHVTEINVFTENCTVRLGDGRRIIVTGDTLRSLRTERGPVHACKNSVKNGGSCGGATGGGSCKSGGCGKDGGCGCNYKKSERAAAPAHA